MAHSRTTRNIIRHAENVRNALPLNTYVMLLHQAAVSGKMPVLDTYGRAVDGAVTHLSGKQRVELVQYLVNKVMPDRPDPTVHIHTTDNLPREHDLAHMSEDELEALAFAETVNHDDSDSTPSATHPRRSEAQSDEAPSEEGTGAEEVPVFFEVPLRDGTPPVP